MKKILKVLVTIIIGYLIIFSLFFYFKYPVLKIDNKMSYYIIFSYVKEKDAFKLDENNVTYIDYSKIKSLGVKNVISYNPVSISLSGLRFLQDKKNNLFFTQANWLLENIKKDGAWYINHDKKIDRFILKSPWSSALSQGLGISVLTRAYTLTQDIKYLNTARKALEPFKKYISEGGITSKNSFGDFYEEYPLKESPTHVLNGYIYALFGLYDLYRYDNNLEAKMLFDKGIKTLKNILPKYDLKSWSRYDLYPERKLKNHWGYASPWYQKLHVAQLYGLYKITNDKYFLDYSKEFEKQQKYSWVNLILYPSYVLYVDFVKIYRLIK